MRMWLTMQVKSKRLFLEGLSRILVRKDTDK